MKRLRVISQEAPPEALMRDRDAVLIGLMAMVAWTEPEVQRARAEQPGVALYLFQDQRGYFMYVVMADLAYARDYAAHYELTLVTSFNGKAWQEVK
jgi:hypothetical protein